MQHRHAELVAHRLRNDVRVREGRLHFIDRREVRRHPNGELVGRDVRLPIDRPLGIFGEPRGSSSRQRPGPRRFRNRNRAGSCRARPPCRSRRVPLVHHRGRSRGAESPRASPPHARRSGVLQSRLRARYMLPSPSLNLIPVHISHPSVVFVRPRPPASSGPFFYAIVRPHHSKSNRELPIVAIWSPKRRAANRSNLQKNPPPWTKTPMGANAEAPRSTTRSQRYDLRRFPSFPSSRAWHSASICRANSSILRSPSL